MIELIATIILLGSLLGMGIIIAKKIPILAQLPRTEEKKFDFKIKKFFLGIKKRVKNIPFEFFLQKVLSKIRILSLKMESKTGNLLQKLREKSLKKRSKDDDKYWQELKKSINKEKKT